MGVSAPAQAAPLVITNQCPEGGCDRTSGNYYSVRAYSGAPGSVTVQLGEVTTYEGSNIIRNALKTEVGTQADSIEWRWRGQNANNTYPDTYQTRTNNCGADVFGTYCSSQIHLDKITITGLLTDKMVQIQFRLIRNGEATAWYSDAQSQSLRHIEARVRDFTPVARISHDAFGVNPIFVLENESFTVSALTSTPNDDTSDATQSSYAWNMYHGMEFQSLISGSSSKTHSYSADGTYVIQVRIRNTLGEIDTETRTVYVSDPPPSNTPLLTLESNRTYTNQASETLELVWPRYANTMSIDDGTTNSGVSGLSTSPTWNFNWSAAPSETKTLTATFFDLSGAQVGSPLTHTVTFDAALPEINNVSATRTDGILSFSITASDQHSGISYVEISDGSSTGRYAYGNTITSPLTGSNFSVRVKDLAGNWSPTTNVTATNVTTPVPNNNSGGASRSTEAVQPVAQPAAAPAPSVPLKSKSTAGSIAAKAGIQVAPGSKVLLAVSKASKKICKVSGGKLVALAPGNCAVTVSVTPKKSKLVKKPKAVKTPTNVQVG